LRNGVYFQQTFSWHERPPNLFSSSHFYISDTTASLLRGIKKIPSTFLIFFLSSHFSVAAATFFFSLIFLFFLYLKIVYLFKRLLIYSKMRKSKILYTC
jgi:hypothetical protein